MIQIALGIVKQKANHGHEISEADLLIIDLLHNPPTISARVDNEDDYHLLELPGFSDDLQEVLNYDGIIVDFYCQI